MPFRSAWSMSGGMAASLPYPALHATHGGIWIAHGRTGGSRRSGRGAGDRAGGRDADDHAQRAADRQPARLSRAERARPARAVRLRPSGALRGADAEGHGATRSASPRRRTTRRRRRSCARRRRRCSPRWSGDWPEREGAWASAQALHRLRWPWAAAVAAAARSGRSATSAGSSRACPNGRRAAPAPQPRPIRARPDDAALERLDRLVGEDAEVREGQRDYAAAAAARLRAAPAEDQPNLLLAEAGTGIGKTLGYLAPASLWARAGRRRGLGLDLHQGAAAPARPRGRARSSPTPPSAAAKIVIRKGRENYLCLLNLEDALQGGFAGRAAILAQLVARWAAYTQGRRHGRRRPAGLADLACSAAPARPRSPTGAANASMPAARITATASSSAPPAPARTPISSSPTMRWSWSTPRAAARRARRRPGSSSTRAIICSTPPIRPSPPP